MVLEHDPQTGEAYLRLPAPLSNIVLTVPRADPSHPTYTADRDTCVAALNDPAVYAWLESPPFPYERHHAEAFVAAGAEDCRRILNSSSSSSSSQGARWADGCPFRDIREIKSESDGGVTGATKIGDIGLSRYKFYELPPDSEEQKAMVQRNEGLAPGHEDLIWGVGCM